MVRAPMKSYSLQGGPVPDTRSPKKDDAPRPRSQLNDIYVTRKRKRVVYLNRCRKLVAHILSGTPLDRRCASARPLPNLINVYGLGASVKVAVLLVQDVVTEMHPLVRVKEITARTVELLESDSEDDSDDKLFGLSGTQRLNSDNSLADVPAAPLASRSRRRRLKRVAGITVQLEVSQNCHEALRESGQMTHTSP